jgi:hypothetical protein
MLVQSRARILCASFVMVCASMPAQADLSIAKAPTQNVTCNGPNCAATAPTAVLNIADLRHLLAKNPAVSVGARNANNITVDAALTWTSSASLTLVSNGSLIVNRPITVAGRAKVIIQSGPFFFAHNGSLTFWDAASSLTINQTVYKLEPDLPSLIADVQSNLDGAYALAKDYDASGDTYVSTPLYELDGHLDGLGHTISHLSLSNGFGSGLIDTLRGTLANLHLADAVVAAGVVSGGVVATNYGVVYHVSVTAVLNGIGGATEIGGLVGENEQGGVIRNSWAKVKIFPGPYTDTGALVAVNAGTISGSWAAGTVRALGDPASTQGGLVAINSGLIANSYTLADTRFCAHCQYKMSDHGGMIGRVSSSPDYPSVVLSSYVAGRTAPSPGPGSSTGPCSRWAPLFNLAGAVVGCDATDSFFASTYWVTDSSRHNPKQAAGNKAQLAGAAGLTEAQLRAALPPGFDPTIWAQSTVINNGYPYLLANPPQ